MAMLTPKLGITLLLLTPIKNKAIKLKRDKVRNLNQKILKFIQWRGREKKEKTSTKHSENKLEFKIKIVRKKRTFKAKFNFFHFLSSRNKKSCNKSVKLHFNYSTQNYEDSIARYFPFSKGEFSQKPNVVFT